MKIAQMESRKGKSIWQEILTFLMLVWSMISAKEMNRMRGLYKFGMKKLDTASLEGSEIYKEMKAFDEGQCLAFCVQEPICVAFMFTKATRKCLVNQGGRVLVYNDPDSVVWVKGLILIPHSLSFRFAIFVFLLRLSE